MRTHAGVGAAVGELAMRPVDRTPLLDQIEDRLVLPGQQPVDRATAGITILERAVLPQPGTPAVRAVSAPPVVLCGIEQPVSHRDHDLLQGGVLVICVGSFDGRAPLRDRGAGSQMSPLCFVYADGQCGATGERDDAAVSLVRILYVGGPTAVIEIGPWRLI